MIPHRYDNVPAPDVPRTDVKQVMHGDSDRDLAAPGDEVRLLLVGDVKQVGRTSLSLVSDPLWMSPPPSEYPVER